MSCSNCENTQTPFSVYNVQYVYKNDCQNCANSDCESTHKASCVFYTAANLPNSLILTDDSLEVALQKIDLVLASVAGNYAGYNINCLGAAGSITTEAQFVEEMTAFACATDDALTLFTGTTFPAYQTAVDLRFDAIEVPGTVNAATGVVNTDTLQQVLTKYGTKFTSIDTALDISGVDWSNCFAVVTPPTTVAEGFTTLLDQICQINSSGGTVLPTFNNIGSVLAAPGATDSLEDTVIKLRDRVNLLPTFNINTLSWNSITQPSVTNIDLQSAIGAILAKLDAIAQVIPTFDGSDFSVSATDPFDVYAGITIALTTPIGIDRYVAVDGSDVAPGTLIDKLVAGTGISFDTVTTPGKIILEAAGTADSYELMASSADDSPDFLDAKVTGGTDDGITISTSYDVVAKKVKITPSVDMATLVDNILSLAETDETVRLRLCAIMATCPTPCSAPQNVQVVTI